MNGVKLLEQPMPAGFGPYPFSIRATDTDDQDRLHLFALFSYMQESAYLGFDAHGHGQAYFDANGYCWLLTRISVALERLPRWGEILTVDTWHQGPRRLVFVRNFRFYDGLGTLLGTASSEWLIARQGSHRPLRPDHVWPQGSIGDRIGETVPVECLKLEPRRPLPDRPILVKYADFSDIDRNHHVNNTRYVAWCVDAVHAALYPARATASSASTVAPSDDAAAPSASAATPPDDAAAGSLMVRRFDINYINEIRIGSKINLFCLPDGDEPGTWHVEAQRAEDGGHVFQARILLHDRT